MPSVQAPAAPASAQVHAQAPLQQQISQPVIRLAQAAPGEHTLILKVAPENLGPVTVRAQVGPEGLRIELFAPNEAGREAVRAILGELRRDLAGTGQAASLTLSQQDRPPGQPGQDQPETRGWAGDGDGRRAFEARGGTAAAGAAPDPRPCPHSPAAGPRRH